jgi:glycine hydroxymethyltransferase
LPSRADDPGCAGLRLGTTAMTIRGLDEAGFRRVAQRIADVIAGSDASLNDGVCAEVAAVAARCPVPAGCMG